MEKILIFHFSKYVQQNKKVIFENSYDFMMFFAIIKRILAIRIEKNQFNLTSAKFLN